MKTQTWLKAGILASTLVVPALIFGFLHGFGKNQFKLPYYIPKIDSTSGEVLLRKYKTADGMLKIDTIFHAVPDFKLLNQDSIEVTNAITTGKVYVANFFFTRCGSICPKMSSELVRVQDAFAKNDNVMLISHSVDPANDTPAVLRAYAQKYDAIPDKWLFLTGNKTVLYQLAKRGYFIPAVDYGAEKQKPDEEFIHSEKLILVDKDRHIRGFYDGTSRKEVDKLILEIKVLLDISEKQ